MRSTFWILVLVAASGCKTVEVAVNYPLAGVHIVAKFEARDDQDAKQNQPSQGVSAPLVTL
jgi:hypothetical protein